MNQYSMIIEWSPEDQLFLVTIPEFSERVVMPCTHGKTREEAIHNGEEVIEMYLEAWQREGQSIPQPKTLSQQMLELSECDRRFFVETLLNPPPPSDKLDQSAKRYQERMQK